MSDSTNLMPPDLGPSAPLYPHLPQIVRLVGPPVVGTAPAVYPGLVQQYSGNLTLRDREACYLLEPNRIPLGAGYYDCRLVGSFAGQPLFVTTCCPAGAFPSVSSSPSAAPAPPAASPGKASPRSSASPSPSSSSAAPTSPGATFFVVSTSGASSSGGDYAVAKPSGTQNGDLLVAVENTWLNGVGAPGAPTGSWTDRTDLSWNSSLYDCHVWVRFASGEPASYTFRADALQQSCVIIFCVRGAKNPLSSNFTGHDTLSATISADATAVGGATEVALLATYAQAGSQAITPPATAVGQVGATNVSMAGSYEVVGGNTTPSRTASIAVAAQVFGLAFAVAKA